MALQPLCMPHSINPPGHPNSAGMTPRLKTCVENQGMLLDIQAAHWQLVVVELWLAISVSSITHYDLLVIVRQPDKQGKYLENS